jgi:glycosyltransferase involved in cell wall biosynthesis
MHDILMITYNRADYTRMALSRLLDTCDESMRVWVWHNGGHEETLDVVRQLSTHPRFHHLEISKENKRLREPTNWFWSNCDGDYLSKVDDDCLAPDDWGRILRQTHCGNPRLGIIGTWRFYDEDFMPEIANRKICTLPGGQRLMANCWVQGSGYVMKRACFESLGPLRENESFPGYCIRAALSGWQNGWHHPFLHEEHMDDPRSAYCAIKTNEQFMAQRPLSAINDDVTTLEQWAARVKHMARIVQEASPDPKAHVGWRRKLQSIRRRLNRIIGQTETWRDA